MQHTFNESQVLCGVLNFKMCVDFKTASHTHVHTHTQTHTQSSVNNGATVYIEHFYFHCTCLPLRAAVLISPFTFHRFTVSDFPFLSSSACSHSASNLLPPTPFPHVLYHLGSFYFRICSDIRMFEVLK